SARRTGALPLLGAGAGRARRAAGAGALGGLSATIAIAARLAVTAALSVPARLTAARRARRPFRLGLTLGFGNRAARLETGHDARGQLALEQALDAVELGALVGAHQ